MAEKATSEKVEAPSTSLNAASGSTAPLSSIESDFAPVKPPRRKNSRTIESALDEILMEASRGVSHQTFKFAFETKIKMA